MVLITKRWRSNQWFFWGLVGFEFPIVISALTLYAIAQPNLYRTRLQKFGADQGWNSDPILSVYAASNHVKFDPAHPWSPKTTEFNVVISIVSLFFLLTKATMYILHCFVPLISVLLHIALIGIYSYSVYIQAAPDFDDPKRPQPGAPWYLSRGCGVVENRTLRGLCRQAQACFAVTILLLVLYLLYFGLSVFSTIPNAEQLERYRTRKADMKEIRDHHRSVLSEDMQWQLHNLPTPGMPPMTANGTAITPRTNAFNLLNGVKQPKPALPLTAMLAQARQKPSPTVVIPNTNSVVVHNPTPTLSSASPLGSTPGSAYKSDLPFRNIV